MIIKPAIRTLEEIEAIVYSGAIVGTHVKRKNAIRKMIKWSNDIIDSEINSIREGVRLKKAQGIYEFDLAELYSKITELEIKKI